MILNIYDKENTNEIYKTYEVEKFKLLFGPLEDLISVLDTDGMDSDDDTTLFSVMIKFVVECRNTTKDLLMQMFDGLTDEELRYASVEEMAVCLADAIKYVFKNVKKIIRGKN